MSSDASAGPRPSPCELRDLPPPIAEEELVPWAKTVVRAHRDIDAPAQRVWELMVDAAGYGDWNPFVVGIDVADGMNLGDELTLHVRMGAGHRTITSRERITRVQAPSDTTWGELAYEYIDTMSMFGMVRAIRWQGVQPLGRGRCRYVTYEGFGGWLWRLLPFKQVQDGFSKHADALARAAENDGA